MRRVLTFLVAGAMVLAVPQMMLAQRGGGHAGGGGHVGGFSGSSGARGFSGSFSAPHAGSFSGFAPRSFPAPRMNFSPGRMPSGFAARPYAGSPQRSWPVARSPFGQLSAPAVRRGPYPGVADDRTWNGQSWHGGHSDGHRPDYHSHSGFTYSISTVPYYPYYAWPWFGGWPYFGNWDSSDYDSGYVSGADTGGATAPSYAEPETAPAEEPESRPAYQPYQAEAAAYSAPAPEPALTIVYKDGRSQQVHNYALTQTTLVLLDDASSGRTQQVSLQEIDLSATEQANRAAGVDFRLPVRN
jgi:hypothetical protein